MAELCRMHRRHFLKFVAGAGAFSVAGPALANASARTLSVLNLHTGERLSAAYYEDGAYLPDAMAALSRVLRDHRTGEVRAISPRLFDLLTDLRGALETQEGFQVISGYRSPQTNATLRLQGGGGVATRSLHMEGMAIDVRLAGVELARVRDAALAMARGGVGYYPGAANNFVHVDVGRVRRW